MSEPIRAHQIYRCTAPRGEYEAEIVTVVRAIHGMKQVVYRNLTWGSRDSFTYALVAPFLASATLVYDPHVGIDLAPTSEEGDRP